MQTKKINFRKLPSRIMSYFLTGGASLIIGFLSFGGIYAILPVISVATIAMILSVIYEAEIYKQNIKGSTKKLFNKDYLLEFLANEFLAKHFPDIVDENSTEFFQEYAEEMKVLHGYGHGELDDESIERRKLTLKKIKELQKWFARILQKSASPTPGEELPPMQQQMVEWLQLNKKDELETFKNKLDKRQKLFSIFAKLSVVTMFTTALGTTYLLSGTFLSIGLLAATPPVSIALLIIGAAIVSGIAYGMLTYNAATDMVNNQTLQKWAQTIQKNWRNLSWYQFVLKSLPSIALISLAAALTLCTAGTWWTIAKAAKPLFAGTLRIPALILGVLVPITSSLSSLVFVTENIFESLEALRGIFSRIWKNFVKSWKSLTDRENYWQIFNPFRILVKLTFTPLRLIFFIGHVVSIGAQSDQVPGFSKILAALFGIITEFFEDVHYFADHEHKEENQNNTNLDIKKLVKHHHKGKSSHTHEDDIPTQVLRFIFSPLFYAAIQWDLAFNKNYKNATAKVLKAEILAEIAPAEEVKTKQDELNSALQNQEKCYQQVKTRHTGIAIPESKKPEREKAVSDNWLFESSMQKVARFTEKNLSHTNINTPVADAKKEGLEALHRDLMSMAKAPNPEIKAVDAILQRVATEAVKTDIYNRHRLWNNGSTSTQTFLEEVLPDVVRVQISAA